MAKTKALISPALLEKLLELPQTIHIFGAESAVGLGGNPMVVLWLEGDGVPEGLEESLATLRYSTKSSFDAIEREEGLRLREGFVTPFKPGDAQ